MNKKILLGSAFTLLAVAPVVAPVASAAGTVTLSTEGIAASNDVLFDLNNKLDAAEAKIKADNDAEYRKAIAPLLTKVRQAIVVVQDAKEAHSTALSNFKKATDAYVAAKAAEFAYGEVEGDARQTVNELEAALEASKEREAKLTELYLANNVEQPKLKQAVKDAEAELATANAAHTKYVEAKPDHVEAVGQAAYDAKVKELSDAIKAAETKLAEAKVAHQTSVDNEIAYEKEIKEVKMRIEQTEKLIEQATVYQEKQRLAEAAADAKVAMEEAAEIIPGTRIALDRAVEKYNAAVKDLEHEADKWNRTIDLDQIAADLKSDLEIKAEECANKSKWVQVDGIWYFYNKKGEKSVGWVKDGDHYYFFNGKGEMQTGWLQDGGHWYYLRANGQMARGWEVVDGTYYMFKAWGPMASNEWMPYGGNWYFLKSNGAMATNTTINGWTVDASGAWV